MSDEGVALARRLFLHVKDGGSVSAMEMSRLVMAMESLQTQRDTAHGERMRLADELAEAEKAILPWIDDVGWLNAEYARHTDALRRISLGSQNSGTTKESLGKEARDALRESDLG
jgi:alkylhydroperoxidase family enzyme